MTPLPLFLTKGCALQRLIFILNGKRQFSDNWEFFSSCSREIRQPKLLSISFLRLVAFDHFSLEKLYWFRAKEVPGWTPDLVEDSDEEELSDDDSLEEGMKNLESENDWEKDYKKLLWTLLKRRSSTKTMEILTIPTSKKMGVWLLNGIDLMIIAVYAPHDPRDNVMLWDYLRIGINSVAREVVFLWGGTSMRFASNQTVLSLGVINSYSRSQTILLRGRGPLDYGPVPFRFFHHWIHLEGFNDFVTSTWNSAPSVDSNGMRNLAGKLKFLKAHIKIWIKDNKSETVSTIANLKKDVETSLDRFAKPSERRANIDMRFPKTISEDQSQDLEPLSF
ncbi:hypothetical protein Tco_1560722 [Tanacetum coccineum]